MKIDKNAGSARDLKPIQSEINPNQVEQRDARAPARTDSVSPELRSRADAAQRESETRRARFEDIRSRVQDGSYRVDREHVARSLVSDLEGFIRANTKR
ncbi:MAG: flagellar biosynthesis anti-sigma factor FlgM [Bdellovibrionales bacterium]|nr:flagellar biosynthesis anti-sigma factor FlgM [Bdellovibrionales bacterium]